MKKVILEIPYLAKVVMDLVNKSDLLNFMEINHKCEESIKCLKVNPFLNNHPSLDWFITHFNPDTVDFHNIEFRRIDFCQRAKLIRNMSFTIFNKMGLLNEEFAKTICPKIKRIRLLGFYDFESDNPDPRIQNEVESIKFIISHSKYFESLDYIEGDLQIITKFLENYTDNGKEIYIKMPKRILLSSNCGYAIELNNQTVGFVTRIEKCLPDNDIVNASIIIYQHPLNKEFLKPFQRIKYYYRHINNGMCEKFSENLFIENGDLWISGCMENDSLNHVIDKACATTINYSAVNDRLKENWNVPRCVETLNFIRNYSTFGDRVVKVNMNSISVLNLDRCYDMDFDKNGVEMLKRLNIRDCVGIVFKNVTFPSLLQLTIDSSREILFETTCKLQSKQIQLIGDDQIEINCEIEGLEELVIAQCFDSSISTNSFEGKKVYIENGKTIKFGKEEGCCPMSFVGMNNVLFVDLIGELFEYPSSLCYDITNERNKDDMKIFRMRKFIPKSNRLKVTERRIERVIYEEENDMVVSNDFYSTKNQNEFFVFKTQANDVKMLQDIRYFEITVEGVSIISIGCIDKDSFDSFENRHVGWDHGSIGFHSDDGFIYFQSCSSTFETNAPYGERVSEINVAGFGYNAKNKEVFFTRNGGLVKNVEIEWQEISAAIGFGLFRPIKINCGEEPFQFDLTIFQTK